MSDTNVHRVVGNLLVGTSHFFVDTTTNQIGVNTSTPSAALDVASGDLKVGSDITIGNSGTITAANFSGNGSGLSGINSDSGSWVNGNNSNVHLAVSTDKVGIGTVDPGPDKLRIDVGNITADTVILNTRAQYDSSNFGYLQIKEVNHTPTSTNWNGWSTRIQKVVDATQQGYIEFNPAGDPYGIAFGNDGGSGAGEVMRIDGITGRVGIGRTDPTRELDVAGDINLNGTGRTIYFDSTGGSGLYWGGGFSRIVDDGDLRICTDDNMHFNTGCTSTTLGTERMVIKSDGDVGIGIADPDEKLHVHGNIAISWNNNARIIMNYDNSYRQGFHFDAGTRTMKLFSTTADSGGAIAFYTRGGAGSSDTDYGTEKMRIAGNGNVGIGKTPDYKLDVHSDDAIHIEQASNTLYETKIHGGSIFIRNPSTSGGYEHMIINNHTASNTTHTTSYIQFRRGDSGNGNAIGTISGNGSTISYGGQSDYRVKENIVPMPISGLDTINNLQPKRFNFIGHPDNTYDGFIAHELQEHIPMAVTGVKDEMRDRGNVVKIDDESIIVKEDVSEPDSLEEGTKWVKLSEEPVYQNVDLSKIVTYLVKAVQELSEENQTLKTRLDALENAA
jgi:hypothetical protein